MKNITILSTVLILFLTITGCKSKEQDNIAVSADGVKISYDVQGQGQPVILFVHGWSCNKTFWKNQVPYFSRGHKVVTIDLGGHGQSGSGREKYTIEIFGKDVAAVIKKLKLNKVILIGHSMGGPVIMKTACLLPDKVIAIVGADTFHDFEKGYPQDEVDKITAALRTDFFGVVKSFMSQMFPADADQTLIDWIVTEASKTDPDIAISAIDNLGKFSMADTAKEIDIPVYSINSDFWPTEIETNLKLLPSYKIKMMTGIGHFVMLEDPDLFNKLLDEVISELDK